MFGFGRAKREAAQVGEAAARSMIMPFWKIGDRGFDPRIWSDAYVLGLIQGAIGTQSSPMTGRNLKPLDAGMVMVGAMRNLGADRPAMELALRFAEMRDPDYARGYDDAVVTTLIMAGSLKEEAYSEPEIIEAKEAVPFFRRMSGGMFGLEQLDVDQELASAYIYLRVNKHKDAHYRDRG